MPSVPLWPEDLNPPPRPKRKSGAQPGNKNALGYRHTPETKQHLSELTKGRPAHENTRQALIESNKRRKGQPRKPFSEEHRQRLAENQRRHWEDPEWRAKRATQVRAAFEQAEALEKMRQAVTAHWATLSLEERWERTNNAREASLEALPSSIEVMVETVLLALGLTFVRQKRIGRYHADFYLPAPHLVIEALGCYFHSCPQCGKVNAHRPLDYDERRRAYLEARGYTVRHIWEHDIRRDPYEALNNAFRQGRDSA